MSTVLALLAKVNRLKRDAIAAQPVDPLACLSCDQRQYLKAWLTKLHAENSETPDSLYAALLNVKRWTPFEWLSIPMVTQDMSEDEAGRFWSEIKERV
jgi:hypothetical protein